MIKSLFFIFYFIRWFPIDTHYCHYFTATAAVGARHGLICMQITVKPPFAVAIAAHMPFADKSLLVYASGRSQIDNGLFLAHVITN